MVFDLVKYWEVAVDGIQIVLCLLILFFLIRNRRRKLTPERVEAKTESNQSFNLQVLSQAINQQVEMAFSNILESIAVERRNLGNVLQLNQFNHAGCLPTENQRPPALSINNAILPRSKEPAGKDELRVRIKKLSARGMSAKQIAEELKTPMGEVELILSLQLTKSN